MTGLMAIIAACCGSASGGTTMSSSAGTSTRCCHFLTVKGRMTRSPTFTAVTPSPTAITLPAPSFPMVAGNSGFQA